MLARMAGSSKKRSSVAATCARDPSACVPSIAMPRSVLAHGPERAGLARGGERAKRRLEALRRLLERARVGRLREALEPRRGVLHERLGDLVERDAALTRDAPRRWPRQPAVDAPGDTRGRARATRDATLRWLAGAR